MKTFKTTLALLATAALLFTTACDGKKGGDAANKAPETAKKEGAAKAEADKPAAKPAEKAAEKAAAKPADKPAEKPAAVGGEDPIITLMAAGAEPHKELRFKMEKGAKQDVEMVMQMSMKSAAMPAMEMPAMEMVMTSEILEVGADGTFDHKFELTAAKPRPGEGVNPMVLKGVEQALAGLVGLAGQGKMTNRGINKGMEFTVPESAPPQARQMLTGMKDTFARISAPLPAEAIGVGGKWSVKQNMEQNGIKMVQTATYEVTAIDGDVITLKTDIAIDAKGQEVKAPGMPDGMKMNLKSMTGSGTGETKITLAKAMPMKATAKVSTSMKSEVGMAGKTQAMDMDTTIDMTLTGK